ncbi:MAG: hypothetical protein HYZ13_09120 [Acidobacteria bacterium]|nr:hypothetical protein [Acidobacteriota bacterium]
MDVLADVLAVLEQGDGPFRDIAKSLSTLGAGTDLAALSGGGAMRVEDLDPVLYSVAVQNKHFDLINRLLPSKRTVFSMLDQQIVKRGIGGYPGSAVSDETATGRQASVSDYRRLVTELGIFVDYRHVPVVTAIQGVFQQRAGRIDTNLVAEENVSGCLVLLESVEHGLLYGDRTVNRFEINGLSTRIGLEAPANVLDLRGQPLSSATPIAQLATRLTKRPWFGRPDLFYVSAGVKSDLDAELEPGWRVNLDSGVPSTNVGVPIKGINYSGLGIGQGYLECVIHAYVDEARTPIVIQNSEAVGGQPGPSLVATVALPDTDPLAVRSQWEVDQVGSYYYLVEAYAVGGKVSLPVSAVSAVAVPERGAARLDITQSPTNTETHYKVYRGRRGGTNQPEDVRLIGSVRKAEGAATTSFVDLNAVIPGTSEALMLTANPSQGALTWIQMLPMLQLPLAMPDLNFRWAALLLGALRLPEPRKHGLITNILPKAAAWRPF